GFFVVNGTIDGVSGNFYTRDGRLKVDSTGNIVNQDGLNAQGYAARPDGTFDAAISSLKVPTSAIPAFATTQMTVTANLDSNAVVPTAAWDVNDPTAGSNFSTSMSVYDSLGNAHTISVYFTKTGTNAWTWRALGTASEITTPAPAAVTDVNTQVGTGTM